MVYEGAKVLLSRRRHVGEGLDVEADDLLRWVGEALEEGWPCGARGGTVHVHGHGHSAWAWAKCMCMGAAWRTDLHRELHDAWCRLAQEHVDPSERGDERGDVRGGQVRGKRVHERVHLVLCILRACRPTDAAATRANGREWAGQAERG